MVYFVTEEQSIRLQKTAKDVLLLSRNTLLVNLRYLDMALSMFELCPNEAVTLLTDGKHLLYDPVHILKCYKAEKEIPVRDYLHVVMHCVFRHMFTNPAIDRPLWDLACDIAVENVINDIGLKSVAASRVDTQQKYIKEYSKKTKFLTAEKIYALLKAEKISPEKAAVIRECFCADEHDIWYMSADEKKSAYGMQQSGTDSDSDENGDGESNEQHGGNGQNGTDGQEQQSNGAASAAAALQSEWQRIAERMQVDMETFGKQKGDTPGGMLQNLKEVNREKYDYASFLKKFVTLGEVMQLNNDEFDYIFYTYGLKLYEKMPLIEPLEYKEVKRIKEFVIAIDTSGSTSGELVQTFIQKTYNILKSTESFFSKINLHIIQCDAAIQEHVKITTQEEFDSYIKNMTVKGLGGTDFRPVFAKVNELLGNKEFTNLKGLIYFTDGYGDFPSKKPDYDTAFVFVDDEYNNPDVPPWAIKLVLQKDEI